MKIVFRNISRQEIKEAVSFYELCSKGLGVRFRVSLANVVTNIRNNPTMYPIVYRGIRQGLMKNFPYSVLYRIEPDRLVVIAVYHQSRDPRRWKGRS